MKVYGLDFTSNPTRSKRLTLAECDLDSDVLSVNQLRPMKISKDGDLSAVESWLHGKERWTPKEWIAGLDFPFGMPIEAIEHFKWLPTDADQVWEKYVSVIHEKSLLSFQEETQKWRLSAKKNTKGEYKGAKEPRLTDPLKKEIEDWRHSTKKNKKGEYKKVRKPRLTDSLAISGTPMNFVRPPTGLMFFKGSHLLLNCPKTISIPPVLRRDNAIQTIVEAYPKIVAKFLGGSGPYKEKSQKRHKNKKKQDALRREDDEERIDRRRRIINGLASEEMQTQYGFKMDLDSDWEKRTPDCDWAKACFADEDGDKLDSVLCAVQAAWSFRRHDFGIPDFSVAALRDRVSLEGWITDPFVLQRFSDGDSKK